MEKLGKYIKPQGWFILLTMFIKLLGAASELAIPYLMEIILDYKVPAALCLVFNITANRMSALSSGRITLAIRHDLFRRLMGFSPRQMDAITVSSAVSRLTSDTYNINQLLARTQRLGVRAPILLLGGIAMMLSMDWVLSLVLIALLPIIGIVVYFVTKTSVPLYTRQQSVLDQVVTVVQENITGIRVIKAFATEKQETGRFDRKAGSVSAITNPAATLVLNLGLTLVVVAGAYRVSAGAVRSGVIVAFLQYFVMILNAMLGITKIFVMFSKGQASANRVVSVLHAPEDLPLLPAADPIPGAPHIAFRNVTFSYNGREPDVENLTFSVGHGQTLGILPVPEKPPCCCSFCGCMTRTAAPSCWTGRTSAAFHRSSCEGNSASCSRTTLWPRERRQTTSGFSGIFPMTRSPKRWTLPRQTSSGSVPRG